MDKVTSLDDIKKRRKEFSEGKIIELPDFDDGQPFSAKLKRLSLLELLKTGTIPNPLTAAAQEIYEGKQRADMKKYAEVLDIICEKALVEPAYEDVSDVLTDTQKVAILAFTQHGVAGLMPFRVFKSPGKDKK